MAAQARKSKVLRIAIIQDRKIKQERLIKAGEPVTIGESPKNTFVVSKNAVTGATFTLFEPAGKGYTLRFSEKFGTKSKVSTGGLAAKLHSLINDSSVTKHGDLCHLQLTPQDRGKLELDNVFVLFQFVAPPPIKAVKPIKAMDFRPRLLEDDDPVFLGFLAIWSALALVLTIWVWNSELPVYTMDEIPDRFAKLAVKEKPPEPPEDLEIETDEEDPNAPKKEVEDADAKKAQEKDQTEGQKAKSQEDRKADVEQRSKLLAKIIGTTGDSSGDIVADMWSDEDKGIGNIDEALSERGGGLTTDANDPGLRGAKGGTGEAADIGDLKGVGGGNAGVGTGPDVKLEGSVGLGNGSVSEEIGDAGKVKSTVRRYSGQMKYCYEQQLKKNRDLQGRVEIGWAVYGGAVESVYIVSNSTGDDALGKCMVNKLKRWKFDSSIEGDVSWPFVFAPKQ